MPYSVKDIKTEIQKFGKPRFIRAELLKRGYTLTDIARELGITINSVRFVIEGQAKSRRVASRIEELLEVPKGTLFPYVLENVEKSEKKSEEK